MPGQAMQIAIPTAPVEAFLLVATRLMAALFTSPVMSARSVPVQARIILGMFTALVLVPVVTRDPTVVARVTWTTLAGELAAGLLAGFAASVMYSAVQFGMGLLDIQSGFAIGSTFDPVNGASGAVLERFYSALAALLFLEMNGHHLFLGALREMFVAVPLGTFNLGLLQPALLSTLVTAMFRIAVQLVLPIVGALLLTDMALSVLARTAPQFNLFTVGIQAKIMLTLGALVVTLPLTFPILELLFQASANMALGVVR